MNSNREGAQLAPVSTHELLPTERALVIAMHRLRFGRIEFLRIERGELVLDPWPATVRGIKFGSSEATVHTPSSPEFELKAQVIEFFQYVRSVDAGEIRRLEVRHGLPFSMEIEHCQVGRGGGHG